MTTIPETLATRPVTGRNLNGATFGEALRPEPCLLVFLRHFG